MAELAQTVTILYDMQHEGNKKSVDDIGQRVSAQLGIKINIDIPDVWAFWERLKSNPNYNFIIMHLANNRAGAYREAQQCRATSSAVLVAESIMFPLGREEVLQHFDDYIGLLSVNNLAALIQKYGFAKSQ